MKIMAARQAIRTKLSLLHAGAGELLAPLNIYRCASSC